MHVISISRRTDIPAFYTDWLLNRIEAGYVTYPNPFSQEIHKVSLLPQDVIAFVFWTKNAGPLIPHLKGLSDKGYSFYFHFTITGYPKGMERNVIPLEDAISQFKTISKIYSPDHVQWRFDPIILTDGLDGEYYPAIFEKIASSLEGFTSRCYTSFMVPYKKVIKNFYRSRINHHEPSLEIKREIVARLAKIATGYGITLMACCSDELLMEGIEKARCVDPEIIRKVSPHSIDGLQPSPTRKQCGCYKSYDIGAYDTCLHGCVYCYANSDISKSMRNYTFHRPEDTYLL